MTTPLQEKDFQIGTEFNDIYSTQFNNSAPTSGKIKMRKVFKFGNHPDIYFYGGDDILILSFHGDNTRVDITRQYKKNEEKLSNMFDYYQTLPFPINNKSITFRDIIKKAHQISKSEYYVLFNNCNHSAEQLIKELLGEGSYPK